MNAENYYYVTEECAKKSKKKGHDWIQLEGEREYGQDFEKSKG